MRIIIYGAGGIGCVIGGHLFRQGYDVVLVGNLQHMDAINTNGLKLVTGNETFVLRIPAVKTANELVPFRSDDVVMLCAKSQHTLRCLGQLRNAGTSRTLPIFICQNSIWNESAATRVFDKIYGVMLFIDAVFLTPGEVINPVTGRYGFIEVGCYPRGKDALSEEIALALRRSGFSAMVNGDIMRSKGTKCLINLSNAIYAITDGKGDAHPITNQVQQEAMKVWSSTGIEWEDLQSFKKRCRDNYGTKKIPTGYEDLSAHGSSWQSLTRRTGNVETEQLNGDIVTLGRMLGIETPYNELLWHIADEMALHREKPGKYTAEELMDMVQKRSS
jgi:2-dehydropantoate 2-reductase